MRYYPKGCRVVHFGAHVEEPIKILLPCSINTIIGWSRDKKYIAVQPRGKVKWWLFVCDEGDAQFVMSHKEFDVIRAAAKLGVE